MSTSIEEQYEAASARAEELKAPATFDARGAAKGTTYPTDSIDVYSDAELGHKVMVAAHEAAAARFLADSIKEAFAKAETSAQPAERTVEDEVPAPPIPEAAPGYSEADEAASKLEAGVAEMVAELQKSVLTFHLRGLAPAQWRLIDKFWRKEIKEPARKNFEYTEEGEEEFNRVTRERNIDRIAGIQNEQIAKAIVKVVRKHDGAEDTAAWKTADVAEIHDTYLESEYDKLKNLVVQLTFANNLFQLALEKDADFLSKP